MCKLSVEDQLLLVLEYWREYRTQFHIGTSWGLSESAVCRLIQKVETLLLNSGKFRLPGKKQLYQNAYTWSVVAIDVTESPIERPKKNSELTIEPIWDLFGDWVESTEIRCIQADQS